MAHIRDYLKGIERDLEYVTPVEGHRLVKPSILTQARRLADIADHNQKYLIMMMDEFLTDIGDRYQIDHEQIMEEFKNWLR